MSDAQATWTLNLDSGPLKAGARGAVSSLEQLRARIQSQQKALDALRASMQRLRGAASVIRFEAIPRELERAQAEVDKLGAKLEQLKAKQATNEAKGFMDIGLHKEIQSAEAQHGGAQGKVKRLQGEQEALRGDSSVKAFLDQKARAKDLEGGLADLESQYSSLGGGAESAAGGVKAPTSAIEELLGAAKGAGGPLEGLAGKLSKLKGAGAAGAIGLVVAAIVVLVTVLAKASIALVRFGLAAAGAARDARIVRQAAAGGSVAGLKDIESAMTAIRAKTAASRDEASQLAQDLYRAGLRGKGLEDAAVTIERFGVLGEETKGQIKALYDQLNKPTPAGMRGFTVTADMLPRDQFIELARKLGKDANKAMMYGAFQAKSRAEVADALKSIGETRFGDAAIQQMMSLGKLSERLHENLEDLFADVGIGPFLGALRKIVMVFDQSTSSGKALKDMAKRMLDPLFSSASKLAPFIEGMFEGITYALLVVEGYVLDLRIAFNRVFPGSFLKNLDLAELGFLAGCIAVGLLVTTLGALAAILTAVLALALVGIVIISLPFIIAGAAVYGLVKAIEAVLEKLGLISKTAEGAGSAIQAMAANLPGGSANAGNAAGAALGAGMAGGMMGKLGDVAKAGAALVAAADKGVTTKAQIHSPSKLFRRRGDEMGEGAALGFEDSEDRVQAAADASMIPDIDHGARGGAAKGSSSIVVHVAEGAIVIQGVKDAEEMNGPGFIRKVAQALYTMAIEGGGPAPEPAT